MVRSERQETQLGARTRTNVLIVVILTLWASLCQLQSLAEPPPLVTSPLSGLAPRTRSRVVAVQDPEATQAYRAMPDKVQAMLNRGLTNLTGQAGVTAAWRSLVSTQDVVGIKVHAGAGSATGTRLAVVEAVVKGLLEAGLPPPRVVVWDRHLAGLHQAGFGELAERYGIRLAGSAEAGYDEKVYYEKPLLGSLVWGDTEFGRTGPGVGRKSFVSKLLTQDITKIINVAPLLNHNQAGVRGLFYSLAMGSVDNTARFEHDRDRLAEALPEIYALRAVGDRVALSIVDALVAQYEGGERTMLHYSAVLNQVRLSTDPVALDVLSFQDLARWRADSPVPMPDQLMEVFRNATLLDLGQHDPAFILVDTLTTP